MTVNFLRHLFAPNAKTLPDRLRTYIEKLAVRIGLLPVTVTKCRALPRVITSYSIHYTKLYEGMGGQFWWIVVVYFLISQVIVDNFILIPILISRVSNLHPLWVILAIIMGGP